MTTSAPIHPFPARMAPQLALDRLPDPKERKLRILDPMMGSGTIPVLAALQGHRAIGFDVDPLALIISRTWGRPLNSTRLAAGADRVVARAKEGQNQVGLADQETQDFVDYWFDPHSQKQLSALSRAISEEKSALQDALWCAFSRLIITKDAGASRARDVSHSRPHRVRDVASFAPIARYRQAVDIIIKRHSVASKRRPSESQLKLERGDARALPLRRNSVDAILTSPPYLQAIDYLRGHRMTLVWMGHSIGELRELRGTSIGSERSLRQTGDFDSIADAISPKGLAPRGVAVLKRYVGDLGAVIQEASRVLRPNGKATFVVADATLEGQRIKVGDVVRRLMGDCEFDLEASFIRPLSRDRRYLPPPTSSTGSLDRRMRAEECLTFRH